MSLFENFPYTNLHELNLDWLINAMKNLEENTVVSVNGQTGEVILYQNASVQFPAVTEDHWSIVRMADGTSRGIMFGNDNKLYILHGSVMSQVYSANNQPPYPVNSVNGMTGDITLYADRVVRLPSLDDADIHSWNIYRNMNSVASGIEFDEAGDAYIIFGLQRYKLYSVNSQPPYPVTMVNGETGSVDLFTDEAGEVTFPEITDPASTGWVLQREVDGHMVGLLINKTGTLSLILDNSLYTVYSSNNPRPDWVDDPTASMIEVSAPSTGAYWGFIRETSVAPVGILFNNATQDSPQAYIQYTDSNDQVQTLKLLTTGDIPASSVVSINGQAGIVVLTGADLDVSTLDTRKVNVVLAGLETANANNRAAMAYNETSNIATHDIAAGSYVFWNNGAYKATQNISYGDTLSSSNLAACEDAQNQSCGFANDINNNLTKFMKRLWSGAAFTTGQISVPDLDKYKLLLLNLSSGNGMMVCSNDGSMLAGGIMSLQYGSYTFDQFMCSFSVSSGTTLKITQNYQGVSNNSKSNYGGLTVGIVEIYGVA